MSQSDSTFVQRSAFIEEVQTIVEALAISEIEAIELIEELAGEGLTEEQITELINLAVEAEKTARIEAVTAESTARTEAIAAEKTAREEAAATHAADTTEVHGVADTSKLALKSELTEGSVEMEVIEVGKSAEFETEIFSADPSRPTLMMIQINYGALANETHLIVFITSTGLELLVERTNTTSTGVLSEFVMIPVPPETSVLAFESSGTGASLSVSSVGL